MVSYIVGVIFGILAGMLNFTGQVVQKKAINDMPAEIRAKNLMISLLHNKTWWLGIVFMSVFATVFQLTAAVTVGGTIMPGLMASGFIVLAIGSAKLLHENLKAGEIVAIGLLIFAIVLIGLSQLSIPQTPTYFTYFNDTNFVVRYATYTIVFLGLWLGLYYGGKKAKRYGSLMLAVGTGFPFVMANIWMQPFTIAFVDVLTGQTTTWIWGFFLLSTFVIVCGNVVGVLHYQYALNSGNASIVVPVQQMPQQIAPILIFFWVYQLSVPTVYSLPFEIIAIALICIAAFILGQRQASLEKIGAPPPTLEPEVNPEEIVPEEQ